MLALRSLLVLSAAALACSPLLAQAAKRGGVTQTFTISAGSFSAWTVDGQTNPALTLQRGGTYVFHLNAVAGVHPFNINTINTTGAGSRYTSGVTNNGATGTIDITFVVPNDAPNTLHYNCQNHAAMNGPITITAADAIFADAFEL
ncbi:hypothetical protein DFR29_106158 [Tahibacter aquaticus]|uniref:Copper binding plastocyanin/azurin family protein n=1 Tax=Tahibacter aquaticus TaxID=520092 RepID=A0A4R6YYF9_9GAMM|nr:hypothetical protein [Tahibacter aquaticus]TDR44012.1 hypothetical protein DFR29_106158 [Tahibacter aquaticus]